MSTLYRPMPSGLPRIACASASLLTCAGLFAAVIGLFGQASSTPWLPDTPEATALASACQAQPSRSARAACMSQLVAQWQAPDRRAVRVAAAP